MNEFERFLKFQREITELKLETIKKYQRLQGKDTAKPKSTSRIELVEDILRAAGRPLHISEIIEIAKRDFEVDLERDSVVSALVKKVKSEQIFVRTAPNTFWLRNGLRP